MRKMPFTRTVVDPTNEDELRRLASEFGVTTATLRIAIFDAGPRLVDLRVYFNVSDVIPFPAPDSRIQSTNASIANAID